MTTTARTKFHATCRKGAWLPLDQLTLEERADVESREAARLEKAGYKGSSLFRWDRKLGEVALVLCSLDTADRDEYLAHMERFHGLKPTTMPCRGESTQPLSNRAKGRWRTPKAPSEYTGVKWSTKDLAASVRACRGCGFVVELGVGSTAIIEEHKATCTARADHGSAA